MFEKILEKKKSSEENKEYEKKEQEISSAIQEKPLICLIDIDEVKEKLVSKGLNITSGSLGTAIEIPNTQRYIGYDCLLNHKFPSNLHEFDIIILNLEKYNIIPYDKEQHTRKFQQGDSAIYFFSKYPETLFDPRPYSSSLLRKELSKNPTRPSILIIFSDERSKTEYFLIEISDAGRNLKDKISVDNYSFSNGIPNSVNKNGTELLVVENRVFYDVLSKHTFNATYNIVFEHPEIRDAKSNKYILDGKFIPLIKNPDDDIISFIRYFNNNVIIVLPNIKDKGSLLEELLTNQLPSMFPAIFPFNSEFNWLKEEAFLLPNENELNAKRDLIIKEYETKKLQIEKEIHDNHLKYEFLHCLLTGTDDELVKNVENYLRWLGFNKVINVDEINPKLKEEDLQVEFEDGLLVIEVKGIGGTSKDNECNQIEKIKNRRAKERGKPDVYGLYIVNHQRFQSPLKRINPPFNEQQIKDAIYDERGLLTTWQLFNLYFSIENASISKEDARKSLLKFGLVEFNPSNCFPLGKAKEIHHDGKVIILDLSTKIELKDELVIKREYKYIHAKILEIKVNNQKVNEVDSGEIGIKIDNSVNKMDEIFLKKANF